MSVNYWIFLFFIMGYQWFLALTDYMVTGVLAKGQQPDGKFLAYVLAQTGMNQMVALYASTTAPTLLLSILYYITTIYCWVGGGLDFLYFMIKGEIPEWNRVWHWMPFKPTTKQYAVYSLIWLIALIVVWGYLLI